MLACPKHGHWLLGEGSWLIRMEWNWIEAYMEPNNRKYMHFSFNNVMTSVRWKHRHGLLRAGCPRSPPHPAPPIADQSKRHPTSFESAYRWRHSGVLRGGSCAEPRFRRLILSFTASSLSDLFSHIPVVCHYHHRHPSGSSSLPPALKYIHSLARLLLTFPSLGTICTFTLWFFRIDQRSILKFHLLSSVSKRY